MGERTRVGDRSKFRNPRGRWLTVASAVVALLVLVVLLGSDWRELLWFGSLPLLFTGLVWAAFERPYVRVDDGGVEIANVVRTLRVPWPAVTEIDPRWGLRLVTKLGTFSAWSVPPPARPRYGLRSAPRPGRQETSGRDEASVRPASQGDQDVLGRMSPAAQEVLRRWQMLREAGYLDNPRLESDRPQRWWNTRELVVLAVLVLLSAAGIVAYRLS